MARTPRGANDDGNVLVLLHGGFWRWPYGRALTWLVVRDAMSHGHTVVNLGYRRLGRFGGGGGWPNTFDDITSGIDMIAERRPHASMVLIGHSAGGHLALVGAGRRPESVDGVVAMSAPSDLRTLAAEGSQPVEQLVAGAPVSDRWSLTSPIEMLPLGVPTVCVHGADDSTVSPAVSERYVAASVRAGDDSRLVMIPGEQHRSALNPRSATWSAALSAAESWFADAAPDRPEDERKASCG